MNPQFHNPQNVTAEILAQQPEPTGEAGEFLPFQEYRFLTVEEVATLADPEQDPDFAKALRCNLILEDRISLSKNDPLEWRLSSPSFNESLTYRTAAALPIMGELIDSFNEFDKHAEAFIKSFNALAEIHFKRMEAQGFWDMRRAIVKACADQGQELGEAAQAAVDCQTVALITTEESEIVEALRNGNPPDDKIPAFTGAEAELADVFLRGMDFSAGRNFKAAEALVAKMKMNRTRAKLHGRKF